MPLGEPEVGPFGIRIAGECAEAVEALFIFRASDAMN
jgi:hypothetical protein